MGLSICKMLIELHGEKIWFDTRVGHGVFFISHCRSILPGGREEESRMKVLIIDDDPAIVENLELTFR